MECKKVPPRSLTEIDDLPLRDRPLQYAVALERALREMPLPPNTLGAATQDKKRLSLVQLVNAHRHRFNHYRALRGVLWVRDDSAHGLDEADELHCEYSSRELRRAFLEIAGGNDSVSKTFAASQPGVEEEVVRSKAIEFEDSPIVAERGRADDPDDFDYEDDVDLLSEVQISPPSEPDSRPLELSQWVAGMNDDHLRTFCFLVEDGYIKAAELAANGKRVSDQLQRQTEGYIEGVFEALRRPALKGEATQRAAVLSSYIKSMGIVVDSYASSKDVKQKTKATIRAYFSGEDPLNPQRSRDDKDWPTREQCEILRTHPDYKIVIRGAWRNFLARTKNDRTNMRDRRSAFERICDEHLEANIRFWIDNRSFSDWKQFVAKA